MAKINALENMKVPGLGRETTVEQLEEEIKGLKALGAPVSMVMKLEDLLSLKKRGETMYGVYRIIVWGDDNLEVEREMGQYRDRYDAETTARKLNRNPINNEVYVIAALA